MRTGVNGTKLAPGVTGPAVAAAPTPMPLRAVIEKVYAVPPVRPDTVQRSGSGSTPTSVEQVAPPGWAVTL